MNRNKLVGLLLMLLVSVATLTGCEEKAAPVASVLSIDSGNTTGAGITIGDSFDEFMNAYGMYQIQMVSESGEFVPFSVEKPKKDMPYETQDVTLMISSFYIDDKPVTTSELKEMLGSDIAAVNSELTLESFLQEHTVVYRYISFEIKDNTVSYITGDYLNYNEEL